MPLLWLIASPQPAPSVWTEELAFNLDFTFHWMPSPKAFIIQQFIEAEGRDSLQKLRFQTRWVSSYILITYWITLWFLTAQDRLPRMYSKTLPFISRYYKCDLMFLEWAVDVVHISLTPAVAYLASPESSPSSLRTPFPRSSQGLSLLSWCKELMSSYFSLQAIPSCQLSTMPFTCCGTSVWNSIHGLGVHNSSSPFSGELSPGYTLGSAPLRASFLQVRISSLPCSRN